MKKTISFFLAVLMLAAAAVYASANQITVDRNRSNSHGGFDYEVWRSSGAEVLMVLEEDGTFVSTWDTTGGKVALFRTGRKFDRDKTHSQIGDIFLTFDVNYQAQGNSYLCVYGWTVGPLIEYYIVEAWQNWRPSGNTSVGTFEADGDTYTIYTSNRINEQSILGRADYLQVWSVRANPRSTGTVTVSDHFKAWEAHGIELGLLSEVSICVQGYSSTGSAQTERIILSYGDTTMGGDGERPPEHMRESDMPEVPDEDEDAGDEPEDVDLNLTPEPPPSPTGGNDNDGEDSNPLVIILGAVVAVGVLVSAVGALNLRKKS